MPWMQICKQNKDKWNYHILFALSCISIKCHLKKATEGQTIDLWLVLNRLQLVDLCLIVTTSIKRHIICISNAQNYNVELGYQYKKHTRTPAIMQPETVNGNAIRACDFKIQSRNELQPFLNLPSHRSIGAASKRWRLILEAEVEECRLRLRVDPERALVGIVQPQPLRRIGRKTLSDTANGLPPNFKSTWARPNWNPKWANPGRFTENTTPQPQINFRTVPISLKLDPTRSGKERMPKPQGTARRGGSSHRIPWGDEQVVGGGREPNPGCGACGCAARQAPPRHRRVSSAARPLGKLGAGSVVL